MSEIYVVGHKNPDTDSIASAIAYANLYGMLHKHKLIACRAGRINEETRFVLRKFKVKEPKFIKDGTGKNLILVDHNEYSQAINDIEQAKIVEVIDHHRLSGDVKTIAPIPFESDVRGATSTIIYERFLIHEKPISYKIAGLLLSGILSDTLLLRSPTTKNEDRIAVKHLSKILRIDYKKYGMEMLKAGCNILKHSPKYIIKSDLKEYEEGLKIAISQVPVVSTKDLTKIKEKLLHEMKKLALSRKYDFFALMLTDIIKKNTELIFIGDKDIICKAFNKKPEGNFIFLRGVVSRKQQVQPYILKALRKLHYT